MPKKNAMTKLSPGLRETLKTLGAGMPDDTRLKVWWIPQVPGKPFEVEVDSIEEGALLVTAFADYDMFQFENHIKPDYSNAGGLSVWDKDGKEWLDWEDDEGNDLDYYLKGGK